MDGEVTYKISCPRWRLPPSLSLSTQQNVSCRGVAAQQLTLTRTTAAASSSARLFNLFDRCGQNVTIEY